MSKTSPPNLCPARQLLTPYVPLAALSHCVEQWNTYPFELRIVRERSGKLGDYRYRKTSKGLVTHVITVNHNLSPHAFLITYLHEVAHLITFREHGLRIRPHGREWQRSFRALLLPILNEEIFPTDLLAAVRHYARRPRATAHADPQLAIALQQHGAVTDGRVLLSQVPASQRFLFRNKVYTKEKVRRTRSLCREVNSGKAYLIIETALVKHL